MREADFGFSGAFQEEPPQSIMCLVYCARAIWGFDAVWEETSAKQNVPGTVALGQFWFYCAIWEEEESTEQNAPSIQNLKG